MTVSTLADAPVARWVAMLAPARQLAEVLAGTQFVPTPMRGDPDAIAAAILYGDELGIDPMQSLASIHVVEGRPQPSSELMRALILRAGHSLAVHEMSGSRVRVSGLRQGRPESERVTVEWTMDMARAAGLANRTNWRNYPRAMLLARAFSDLARVVFPDVVKGLGYVIEDETTAADLESWGTSTADVLDEPAPAPRKAIQRARKPRTPTTTRVADDDVELPPVATGEPEPPPVAPPIDPGYPAAGDVPLTDDDMALADPVTPPPEPTPVTRAAVTEDNDDEPPTLLAEPEQPEPEPPMPGHVPRISPGPLKAVHTALTKELGTAATDDERRSMLSAVTGRLVESSKDLTRAEGYDVLSFLARVASGAATYDLDVETGAIVVHDDRLEPPPEDI